MSAILKPLEWFYHEFGVAAIHETGRNAYLIICARALRMFAYGTNSLILGELEIIMHGTFHNEITRTKSSPQQRSSSPPCTTQTTKSASSSP